jgi:cytochrome c2
VALTLLTAAPLAAATATLGACDGSAHDVAAQITGGDPDRGQSAIRAYGCPSCHTIPGIRGRAANVGPPLARIATRIYIAGVLPNTPENMIRWLTDPPRVDSLTAMPNLGVTAASARDIAAYLYTLR